MIGIVILILIQMGVQIQESNNLTYEKCCGGNVCSDTYYDQKDNKCKYVFEEQYKLFSEFNLVYLGIAVGTALILAFGVSYMANHYGSTPVDEMQHFDSFDTGEAR
jgi:hypothetical protein